MIKHLTDNDFEQEIKESNGVILVDFYATWCGPCSKIAPILEKIASSRQGYVIAKVDVDKCPNISQKLKIDVIPTLCLYKDGVLIAREVGYRNEDEIVHLIEDNM